MTEALTDDGQLYQCAADAYLSATKQGRSALLVSPTWAEIKAVTDKVRETLKAEGVVSRDEQTLCVFDSLLWTSAQKQNASQFEPAQRLRFVRQTKQFDRGETAEVVNITDNALTLRRADGTEAAFNPSRAAASFDVGAARELKVAPGDWLLLQANHGAAPHRFVNGERVQVREIHNGRIALADGRTLPAEFNTFTHGYAVTSHSSQSKTVDDVLLVASSRSFAAVNQQQFYVSISRGRERCHVFTDDAELLARRVTDSHERKAAVELQALRDELARLGFVRRPEAEPGGTRRKETEEVQRRETNRLPMRDAHFAALQRIAQVADDVRRRITKRVTQKIEPVESATQTEKIEQAEKIAPTVTESPTVKLRRRLAQQRQQSQQQRQSRGIRM